MVKQRVSMADVAEVAQVSKMTVSRVLNHKPGVSDDMRQRILEAAGQLGYMPQPHALTDSVSLIALLIPNDPTLYLGEVLRGISGAAEQLNCGLMLYTQNLFNHAVHPDNILSPLRTGLVDGMVMIVPRNYEEIMESPRRYELPFVIVDHRSQAPNEASVTATNRKGMLEATRYLLALGHRRIGFITGRMDIACSHDRLQGYKDGLNEVGLPYDMELVLDGDYLQASGFQQSKNLLEMENRPTALLVSNDLMAYGALEAARVLGLTIGQDVSIIGFDDIFLSSQTYPPLTTVRQPLMEMGEVALDMLVDLIQGRRVLDLRRELPTELIVRETTGRVPE
ncbi:MAG: LacI family transcriptional regulator [Chloroflexi bacterium]|nr:LacI family transcriptional regulator [Chloroflexota bacterium]